ncbi:hypothetical protein BH20CHL2_BH20CHL2_07960 [soil metagenome]
MTSPDILDRLPDNDASRAWLSHLASLGADIPPVCLPEPARMLDDLLDLAVPHEDIDAIIALAPSQDRNPDAWGLLERIVAVINSRMGEIDNAPTAPDLPGDDPLARYFHVYPLLALKPLVEDWHRQRGIPPDISRRTLADLGRNLAVHRKRFGTGGTSLHQWLQLHFRGAIYQLGRLQFQRWTLGETSGTPATRLDLAASRSTSTSPTSPDRCGPTFATPRSTGRVSSSPPTSRKSRIGWRCATPGCSTRNWATTCRSDPTSSSSSAASPSSSATRNR